MRLSSDRILTTHAGSLPRPPELEQLLFDVLDEKPVDDAELQALTRQAIADVVARQREVGLDVISDGEMGKVGFSNYVIQRLNGFEIPEQGAQSAPGDLLETPDAFASAFAGEGSQHLRMPVLNGPIEPRGTDAVAEELDAFQCALDGIDPDDAFVPAVTPGQVAFNFPNRYYASHREYVEAAAAALKPEYEAIVRAGFNLQLDSPDAAMAFHFVYPEGDVGDPREHLATGIEVLNDALADVPAEKLRYHVCWGNYRGPHHKDVPLPEIVGIVLRTKAKFVYVEGANPRHEHEWEVWKEAGLPDDKALIVGVIDPKTNHVEHPEVVAKRIERFASVVGRERVIAAPDCGFATFVGAHPCPPSIAWLKLRALVEGAQLASERLWPSR
jgi:5-methyltetrahydropteroyltriglutamate--homocysteine methyltransferase